MCDEMSRGGAREPVRVSWGDRPSADARYLMVGPNAFTGMTFSTPAKMLLLETAESARG